MIDVEVGMNKPALNAGVELHDSTLGAIEHESLEVRVHLTPTYIHKSAGEPGVAPGTGWTQNLVLVVREGILEGGLPEMPCVLADGTLSVGTNLWRNVLPLPLEYSGNIILTLEIMRGGQLTVTGKNIRAIMIGGPKYIEEFDGI